MKITIDLASKYECGALAYILQEGINKMESVLPHVQPEIQRNIITTNIAFGKSIINQIHAQLEAQSPT